MILRVSSEIFMKSGILLEALALEVGGTEIEGMIDCGCMYIQVWMAKHVLSAQYSVLPRHTKIILG